MRGMMKLRFCLFSAGTLQNCEQFYDVHIVQRLSGDATKGQVNDRIHITPGRQDEDTQVSKTGTVQIALVFSF